MKREDIPYIPGIKRIHFAVTDSTQTQAKQDVEMLEAGQWLLYTAGAQTAGRGQYQRTWVSPPDVNIYATFMFALPNEHSSLLFHIPQVSAIAIAKTLEEFGFHPMIKWVNDLLLNEKKIGGVLCESQTLLKDGNARAVMIGIGLNVNMTKSECDKIDQPATSLFIESGKQGNVESILKILSQHLLAEINRLIQFGFKPFWNELFQRLAFIGQKIVIEKTHSQNRIEGIFCGIDPDGRLELKIWDGEVVTLQDGRIIF